MGIKTVTPVVDMVSGVDGVAYGELRGGRWLSGKVIFPPQWVSIKIEKGDGFTRGRGSSWWREWRGGGSGGAGMIGAVAAAAVAGDGEEDLPGSIGCHGRASGAC